MTPTEQKIVATARFYDADDAWGRELRRVFGRRAGDARYTAEGKSTPELSRLHAIRETARQAWEDQAF